MAYCYKCGKTLIDGDRFCTHCGTEQSYITGGHKHNQERKHVPQIELHPVRWINNLAIVQTIKKINFWKIIRFFVLVAFAIGGLLFVLHIFESNSTADAKEEEQIQSEANVINGHEYVDLGLSVKWATCNIGADSPEEYGDYFAWGETKPKTRYDWDNYFDLKKNKDVNDNDSWYTYKIGATTTIDPYDKHDAAREIWGGSWRLPTVAEKYELYYKCTWKWIITHDFCCGYRVTGPNGNSIFLPAAGWYRGTEHVLDKEVGIYWLNSLTSKYSKSDGADYFGFDEHQFVDDIYTRDRYLGRSIRPVSN